MGKESLFLVCFGVIILCIITSTVKCQINKPPSKYGASCNFSDDCDDGTYFFCRNYTALGEPKLNCTCRGRLDYKPIKVGPNKGVMWCLRKTGEDCSPRESEHEDCISGFCHRSGSSRKCSEIGIARPIGHGVQNDLFFLTLLLTISDHIFSFHAGAFE